MKVSRNWLQTFFFNSLPDAETLSDALTFHAFEIESVERSGDDWILDVKVTPNRGHDCLSHRGIARELAAILNIPLKKQDHKIELSQIDKKTEEVSVLIETDLCSRYIAGYIKGVKVGPSPAWLKARLESIGQRSINNIVDAANFVMFNIGQPLHAFDASKVADMRIAVRSAFEDEWLTSLDNKELRLKHTMLVIADTKQPLAVAGVKGGKASEVYEKTTDLILESANFSGSSVRKTAQALKLRTDASSRFEQVISPDLAQEAMRDFVEIILDIAGGTIVGFCDVYPKPQKTRPVAVSLEKINAVLGTTLRDTHIATVLKRLDLSFEQKGLEFIVQVPRERLDLNIPEDLIEEVGRIVGYDRVPSEQLPSMPTEPEIDPVFYGAELVREELLSQGYSEVYTSVFRDSGERVIANKIDGERPYLRSNLQPSLADAWVKNSFYRDLLGLKEVKLFEIGTIWKGGKEVPVVGTVEGTKSAQTQEREVGPAPADVYERFPVSQTFKYEAFSKYPYIVRDIAMWVPSGTEANDVLIVLKENAGDLLVRCEKFDEFKKGEKVSYAFRLVFQSFDRTLTDDEANSSMEQVNRAVKEKGWEVR